MTSKLIPVTEQTGVTAYSIAKSVLEEHGMRMAGEYYAFVIEEWIVEENNNNYRFAIGSYVNVPKEFNEIVDYIGGKIENFDNGVSGTLCHDGWRLTITGKLVKGAEGWLMDENGLYILKDGRRLDKRYLPEISDLRIGNKDIWIGLKEILGTSDEKVEELKKEDKDEYNTNRLFKFFYGPRILDVVYQAFQINRGYYISGTSSFVRTIFNASSSWESCTKYNPVYKGSTIEEYETLSNCSFGVIGRDETDIPIIVTKVGKENAIKKLVIAGPHGNERNARFVVLETQRYFIENSDKVPDDLVLYFIPAMSPTMFFADARGLPIDKNKSGNGNYLDSKATEEEIKIMVKNKVAEVLKSLTIPGLHDDIAYCIERRPRNEGSTKTWQDLIQEQKDAAKPEYGIDTNRDIYQILPSTQAFSTFIERVISTDVENSTVIMLHGYEGVHSTEKRTKNSRGGGNQGTVLGPYTVNGNGYGIINPKIKRYVDFMTSVLFGYTFFDEDTELKNYFYLADPKVASSKGEWSWLLYKKDGTGVHCFDIELGESYRDGSRGKEPWPNASGRHMPYDWRNIVNREMFPFFKKTNGNIDGRFTLVKLQKDKYVVIPDGIPLSATIPFQKLIEDYFKYRGKWSFPENKNK